MTSQSNLFTSSAILRNHHADFFVSKSFLTLKTYDRLPAGFVSNPIAQTPLTSRKERREPMGAYGMRNSLESEFRKTFGSHRSLYSRNNHNNISNIQNNNNNNNNSNNNNNNNNNNSDDEDNCNNNNNRHLINIFFYFRFNSTGSGQNLSVCKDIAAVCLISSLTKHMMITIQFIHYSAVITNRSAAISKKLVSMIYRIPPLVVALKRGSLIVTLVSLSTQIKSTLRLFKTFLILMTRNS